MFPDACAHMIGRHRVVRQRLGHVSLVRKIRPLSQSPLGLRHFFCPSKCRCTAGSTRIFMKGSDVPQVAESAILRALI